MLKQVDSNIYIEVRPKYLMPDTNCFIDCLEDFEKLCQAYTHYTLIIPLTGKCLTASLIGLESFNI